MKSKMFTFFVISLVQFYEATVIQDCSQNRTIEIRNQKVDINVLFKDLREEDCGKITAIILTNVSLRELPPAVFSGLNHVETVKLDHNLLSHLPSHVFAGLGSLSSLSVSNNNISAVSSLHLPGPLASIDFSANKISNSANKIFSATSTFQVNYAAPSALHYTNSSVNISRP